MKPFTISKPDGQSLTFSNPTVTSIGNKMTLSQVNHKGETLPTIVISEDTVMTLVALFTQAPASSDMFNP